MDARKFISSWPALWLWMNYLDKHLVGAQIDTIYTFRKARLDLHFTKEDQSYKLSWEKQGNQAILTFSNQTTLPKKRVNVLRSIPAGSKLMGVQLHAHDRLLRFNFTDKYYFLIGFFPAVMNVYLNRQNSFIESFLKQSKLPDISDEWMDPEDELPDLLPGKSMTNLELQAANRGICIEPDKLELTFGSEEDRDKLDIHELVIEVLKHSQKPKQATGVSVRKTAKTVLQRWKNKLTKLNQEFETAKTWPELEIRLQALQIGLGIGDTIYDGTLQLSSELSPTGIPMTIDLEAGTSLQQVIESTAKKIRKFKNKLKQLDEIISEVRNNIQSLELLLEKDDAESLQIFLKKHGEALDRSGRQQTERKPYKKYHSPGGFDILVGRSSSDNDTLTFKVANKNDWWFHVRQIRGSHVILRTGSQIPQQSDLVKAAEFAALNSKAKHSGIVVVQYCQRKHLSKPKGSSPGTVLVHQEHSITIDLDQVK